jgi:HEAT repeat protein
MERVRSILRRGWALGRLMESPDALGEKVFSMLSADDQFTRDAAIRLLDARTVRPPLAAMLGPLRGSEASETAGTGGEVPDAEETWALGLEWWERLPREEIFGRALDTGDVEVRLAAATELGRIGTPQTVDALRRAADDPDSSVRAAANAAVRRVERADRGGP